MPRHPRPKLNNVISYRVDDLDWIRMSALKATFPDGTWPELFDWVFQLEEVQRQIALRLDPRPKTLMEILPEIADEPLNEVMADIGYTGNPGHWTDRY